MAGFNPKKDRDIDIEVDDIDTDIDVELDEDDDYSQKPSRTKPSRSRGSRRPPQDSDEDDDDEGYGDRKVVRSKSSKKETDKTVFYIAGAVALVVIIGVGLFVINSSKKKKEQEALAQAEAAKQTVAVTDEEVAPGIPNFYSAGDEENDEKLYDPSLITKDLNGNTVATNYKVISSEEVTDYINYKKFRASTGNGLEFYWLEAEYKGQPYKVQVPFSIYSQLDESGITVVDMEVLTLEDNAKMITYMSVRENAKSLLESDR